MGPELKWAIRPFFHSHYTQYLFKYKNTYRYNEIHDRKSHGEMGKCCVVRLKSKPSKIQEGKNKATENRATIKGGWIGGGGGGGEEGDFGCDSDILFLPVNKVPHFIVRWELLILPLPCILLMVVSGGSCDILCINLMAKGRRCTFSLLSVQLVKRHCTSMDQIGANWLPCHLC